MHLRSIELENFGSYESASLPLTNLGLVLLDGENRDTGGSNGAGKSTILNAICWGLYGKTSTSKNSTDFRRIGTKQATVTICLEVGGNEIKVERVRAASNALRFWINGTDSRLAGIGETQALLTKTLEMDYATFLSVVLFPQGGVGLASLTDKDQKHVLSQVLNLDRFDLAQDKVSEWLKEDAEKEDELKRSIRSLDAQLEQVIGQEEALKGKEAEWLEVNETAVKALEQRLQTHRSTLPLKADYAHRDALLVEYSESRQDDALNLHDQATHRLNEALQVQAKNAGLASSLRHQGVTVLDPETELVKHEDCPSCGQSLPDEALHTLLASFHEQRQTQLERNAQIKDQLEQITKEGFEHEQVATQCRQAIQQFEEVVKNAQRLERAIAEATREIEVTESAKREWDRELTRLSEVLEQERAKVSPYGQLIEDSWAQAEAIRQRIKATQAKLEPFAHNLTMLKFWRDAFGNKGVKSLLLSTITPYLNERANVYIRELTNDQASITISTQTKLKSGEYRDQLSFEVEYPHTGSIYLTKSGGEKRRADIAIQFAMADLAATRAHSPVWLALLDEIFDNLDAQGAEAVVNLLNTHIVPTRGTVLVLSHSDALKPLFENRITVVKKNGVSKIYG